MISSLRRNLQREYIERLIDLTMPSTWSQVSHKPVATLALMHLRNLADRLQKVLDERADQMDAYSLAHLTEARLRMQKAIDAEYVLNSASSFGLPAIQILIGQTNAPVMVP